MRKMRVVVGMSGGVDSCVAALLLKEAGYDVIGMTMKLLDSNNSESYPGEESRCCSLEDIFTAKRVAGKLCIPHYTIDCRAAFKQEVVDYFVKEYISGKTPNPCVVCNQRIKFGLLLNKAIAVGADYIATGHYARLIRQESGNRNHNSKMNLIRGKDKDQSYFLCMVAQESFAHVMFPLGEYTKEEVRKIGADLGVDKKESQEICFIPDGDYVGFIKMQNVSLEGRIMDKSGNIIGHHKGIIHYTIGQRRGLGIAASTPFSTPLYVIGINARENAIIVGEEKDLFCKSLVVDRVNWLLDVELPLSCEVQVRYRSKPAKAVVLGPKMGASEEVIVEFEKPHKSITPGQVAVFYKGATVVGGGWIKSSL